MRPHTRKHTRTCKHAHAHPRYAHARNHIRIHYPKMATMLRADTPDMGDGHAATEAKLLRRFRQLITYCVGPRLPPDLLQSVLDSMDVEITLFKGIINWTQSRIFLLFNRQTKP